MNKVTFSSMYEVQGSLADILYIYIYKHTQLLWECMYLKWHTDDVMQ